MPMIDLTIPEGALTSEAEAALIKEVVDILITSEGFDPAREVTRQVTVTFLHRPDAIYVGGELSPKPRYRVVPSVPEGKYTDEAVEFLVREITAAFVKAEGSTFDDVAARVWIFPTEVPEGRWGGRGGVRSIVDTQAYLTGNDDRSIGAEILAARRRAKALELLDPIIDTLRKDKGGNGF